MAVDTVYGAPSSPHSYLRSGKITGKSPDLYVTAKRYANHNSLIRVCLLDSEANAAARLSRELSQVDQRILLTPQALNRNKPGPLNHPKTYVIHWQPALFLPAKAPDRDQQADRGAADQHQGGQHSSIERQAAPRSAV